MVDYGRVCFIWRNKCGKSQEASPQISTYNYKVLLQLHSIHQFNNPLIDNMPPPEEEEEDYMSMIIEEPKQKETFTQKKLRQQREVPTLTLTLTLPYYYNPTANTILIR